VGGPVDLDDDGKPELERGPLGRLGRQCPAALREPDAVALERDGGLELRQGAGRQEVGQVDRRPAFDRRADPGRPAGGGGDRAHGGAGSTQQRQFVRPGVAREVEPRVGRVHGGDRREHGGARDGVHEGVHDRAAPDALRGAAKPREVHLREQDVELAGVRQRAQGGAERLI